MSDLYTYHQLYRDEVKAPRRTWKGDRDRVLAQDTLQLLANVGLPDRWKMNCQLNIHTPTIHQSEACNMFVITIVHPHIRDSDDEVVASVADLISSLFKARMRYGGFVCPKLRVTTLTEHFINITAERRSAHRFFDDNELARQIYKESPEIEDLIEIAGQQRKVENLKHV